MNRGRMTPERWHRIEALFETALERPPRERAAFLVTASTLQVLGRSLAEQGDPMPAAQVRRESFGTTPGNPSCPSLADRQQWERVGGMSGEMRALR